MEQRTIRHDPELGIEAYRFQGVMQAFPEHFHDYYVIGFVEQSRRRLRCRGQEYIIDPGTLLLFNPREVHTCEQVDERPLDYRCLNIKPDAMLAIAEEITGTRRLPRFSRPVVENCEFLPELEKVHAQIMREEKEFCKEENFLFLMGQLIESCSDEIPAAPAPRSGAVRNACAYLEQNWNRPVSLDSLSRAAGLSKYHFLRSFTRQQGISPYRYLIALRVGHAGTLLKQGVSPAETARMTGFSDQSHFTNSFKKVTGLTPRQYQNIFRTE